MYTLDKAGRPRLNGKLVKHSSVPESKKFQTPLGPCVVVAQNMQERVALANAEKPEDLAGYNEALEDPAGYNEALKNRAGYAEALEKARTTNA